MARKQQHTQPAQPKRTDSRVQPVELRQGDGTSGMTELCSELAAILARICSEPDRVQSRRIP
jgi:hypothetical protein